MSNETQNPSAQPEAQNPSVALKCDDCGKEFNSSRGLNIHKAQVHSASPEPETPKDPVQPEAPKVDAPVEPQNVPVPPKTAHIPPSNSEQISLNGTASPATQQQILDQTKKLKQLEAERASIAGRMYYTQFPAIRSEICEFCGVNYKICEHYKDYHAKLGDFICLCGRSRDAQARQQLSLLYVPHRTLFVCDSSGCEQAYVKRFGGFEKKVSWHFFRREVPLYASQLPDPSDHQPTNLQ